MITVEYNCAVEKSDIEKYWRLRDLKRTLTKNGYEYVDDDTQLLIYGEIEIDDYTYTAVDVKDELEQIIYEATDGVCYDVHAKQKDDPDNFCYY